MQGERVKKSGTGSKWPLFMVICGGGQGWGQRVSSHIHYSLHFASYKMCHVMCLKSMKHNAKEEVRKRAHLP